MKKETYMVAFGTGHAAAYLLVVLEGSLNVFARWFKGRPELSTFDPARWRLSQAHEGMGGTFYDAEPVCGYF